VSRCHNQKTLTLPSPLPTDRRKISQTQLRLYQCIGGFQLQSVAHIRKRRIFGRDKADNRISTSMKAIWGAKATSLYPIGCQPMATRSVVANTPTTIDMKQGGD
jgi:hypothetical protein